MNPDPYSPGSIGPPTKRPLKTFDVFYQTINPPTMGPAWKLVANVQAVSREAAAEIVTKHRDNNPHKELTMRVYERGPAGTFHELAFAKVTLWQSAAARART